MKIRIYAGEKLEKLVDNQPWIDLAIEPIAYDGDDYPETRINPDDVDAAYSVLAESVVLKDQSEGSQDLIDFENCEDDDVATMLKDLKRMGFIDYETIK